MLSSTKVTYNISHALNPHCPRPFLPKLGSPNWDPFCLKAPLREIGRVSCRARSKRLAETLPTILYKP